MGEIHKKILIINKRFYLLTEIFRQPTKIEKFNRLTTKIENFKRLPTKLLNFNRQPTSGRSHSDPQNTEHEDSSSTSMKFEPVVWRAIISIVVLTDDRN